MILIEDERSQSQMQRVPALSTLVAIARVLSARRALDAKFGGKGEVRYATSTVVPSFLSEAITRAGASIAERDGEKIKVPASPAGVSALIDVAFSDLAHHVRSAFGVERVSRCSRSSSAAARHPSTRTSSRSSTGPRCSSWPRSPARCLASAAAAGSIRAT